MNNEQVSTNTAVDQPATLLDPSGVHHDPVPEENFHNLILGPELGAL